MTRARGRQVVILAVGDRDRASSRLRAHAWADRLELEGAACTTLMYYDPSWMKRGRAPLRYPRIRAALRARGLWRRTLAAAGGADAALLQEVVPPPGVVRRLRAAVGRLVFDLSDPIHSADAPGRTVLHRLLHRRVFEPKLEFLIRAADVTLVENDRVGEWVAARGGRVQTMRGPVDTERYRPRAERANAGVATLGWTGSNATLSYLESLRPVLEQLYRERRDFRLVAFGVSRPLSGWALPVETVPWSAEAEPDVVAGFDIGLNPLPASPWGRLRGGAKLVTYMAAGVPVVSDDAGIADQVVRQGRTGFVASSAADWGRFLGDLLGDPGMRAAMGTLASAEAVQKYSYDGYRPLLDRALFGGES